MNVTTVSDDYMQDRLSKAKTYTLVLISEGPDWDSPEHESLIWEHRRRNTGIEIDGVFSVVCPVFDDSALCGLYLFDGTVEEVSKIMAEDPGVTAGIFSYEVHPVVGFPPIQTPLTELGHRHGKDDGRSQPTFVCHAFRDANAQLNFEKVRTTCTHRVQGWRDREVNL
jgi:hypothetical protein